MHRRTEWGLFGLSVGLCLVTFYHWLRHGDPGLGFLLLVAGITVNAAGPLVRNLRMQYVFLGLGAALLVGSLVMVAR